MRTTLNLDEQVLREALDYAGGRSKTQLINDALREFVRRKRQKKLLGFQGKVKWEGDPDALRRGR